MLDKKEERLLRISSFYPAKQLFILWFGFEAKEKILKRKNKIHYFCVGITIQNHAMEIFC